MLDRLLAGTTLRLCVCATMNVFVNPTRGLLLDRNANLIKEQKLAAPNPLQRGRRTTVKASSWIM